MTRPTGSDPPEPHFQDAQRWWTKMRRPVTFTGVPGHPFQPAVLWNAGLVFSPLTYARVPGSSDLKLSGPPGLMRELEGCEADALQVEFSLGSAFRFPDRMDNTSGEFAQELLEGRMPIVVSRASCDGLDWTCLAFSRLPRGQEARTGSETLLTEVRWTVGNPSSRPLPAQLSCHLSAPHVTLGYKVALDEQARAYARALRWAPPLLLDDRAKARLAAIIEGPGEVAFHSELPEDLLHQSASPLAEWHLAQDVLLFQAEVPPGDAVSFRLLLPYFAVEPVRLQHALRTTFDQALARSRRYWIREFGRGGAIQTPERVVSDSFHSYLYQAMLAAGRKPRAGHWILKTSPCHYEGLWGAHASIAAFSLDLCRKHRWSRRVLDTFLANQGPIPDSITRLFGDRPVGDTEGFSDHPGFLGNIDGFMAVLWAHYHGWTMWAIGQHARLTNDWDWLRGSADRLALACEWIADQRGRTKRLDASGEKALSYGLLPAANAFDWGFGHMFWSDAHTYRGLAEAARCLDRIGHPRAAEFLHEAESYRQDIISSVTRSRDASPRVPLDDGSSLPFVPMSVEMRDYFAPDWTYVACGPLNLTWADVVPADHEVIEQVLAFLDAGRPLGEWDEAAGERQGWDWPSRAPADDDFLEATRPTSGRCHLWRRGMTYEPGWIPQAFTFLARDDLFALFEHFYSLISHGGQHVDLRSPIEQRDGVPWTQPGQANLLWLMRSMLLREEGERLILAGSCPRAWLADGSRIAVRGLPTFFGRVTYDLTSHTSQGRIAGALVLDLHHRPAAISLRLRHPDGALPRAVRVSDRCSSDQLTDQAGSEWISLPSEDCVFEVLY